METFGFFRNISFIYPPCVANQINNDDDESTDSDNRSPQNPRGFNSRDPRGFNSRDPRGFNPRDPRGFNPRDPRARAFPPNLRTINKERQQSKQEKEDRVSLPLSSRYDDYDDERNEPFSYAVEGYDDSYTEMTIPSNEDEINEDIATFNNGNDIYEHDSHYVDHGNKLQTFIRVVKKEDDDESLKVIGGNLNANYNNGNNRKRRTRKRRNKSINAGEKKKKKKKRKKRIR